VLGILNKLMKEAIIDEYSIGHTPSVYRKGPTGKVEVSKNKGQVLIDATLNRQDNGLCELNLLVSQKLGTKGGLMTYVISSDNVEAAPYDPTLLN